MYNENASFYLAVWSVRLLLIGSVCALCRPDNWCNIPLSVLDHFSLLKLFSELPLKSNKRAWESRARTVSLSLQQTGPAATWRVTGKTQHPADSQRAPRQQRDPGPGYLRALKRRDRWPPFGLLHIAPHRRRWNHTTLHLGWADNPRNQNITISAEWTIARAGIMSPAENRARTHTHAHVLKMSTNIRFVIWVNCSGKAFAGQLTSHIQLLTRSPKPTHAVQ